MGATRRRIVTLVAAGLGCFAAAGPAAAQSTAGPDSLRLSGLVLDGATGEGIPEVRVYLVVPTGAPGAGGTVWAGVTDEGGAFAAMAIPAGVFELRTEALGYRAVTSPVDLRGGREMEVRVELPPAPLELEPLVVVSRRRSRLEAAGFYERRRAGQGYSLTREEIEAHRPLRASDLFRRIPGVQLETPRRGGAPLLRFRGCYPDVVLDGAPLGQPVAIDQILTPDDIEAVEVHSGAFFPARVGIRSCGTVMIWSREGSSVEPGKAFTFGRFLAAAVFVALSVLLTR